MRSAPEDMVPQSPTSDLKAPSLQLWRSRKKAIASWVTWLLTADYDIGGGDTKRTELNIRSVKNAEVAKIPPFAALQVPLPIPPPVLPQAPPIDHPILALATPIEETIHKMMGGPRGNPY
jgi:hypothetical protein